MRLALSFPASWTVQAGGASSPDGGLTVRWGELSLLPDDEDAWIDAALAADLPPGARLEPHGRESDRTRSGWPIRLSGADVLDGAELRERRIAVRYAFLEHGAIALVRARPPASLDAHGADLREALRGGAPDWSGPVVALAPLLDVASPPRAPVEGAAPWHVRVVAPAPGKTEFQILDGEGRRAPLTLTLESSELGRAHGAPFVLGAEEEGRGYRLVEVFASAPEPDQLRAAVERVLREVLG